ncbi:MAG: hypothetical protein KDK76_04850 [Chlamydiia bacterium]|nr:hypothetical protein [Chlamydiia bacterium]
MKLFRIGQYLFLFFWSVVWAAPHIAKDYWRGKDLAESHQLPMALVFTGSDGLEPSQTLVDEVFRNAPSEFIFVRIDDPNLKTQSETLIIQNQALKEKYEIEQFPTLVLVDLNEQEIARLGYPIEGVSDFGKHLREIGRRYFLLQKRFDEAKKKKGLGELKMCFDEAQKLGAKGVMREIIEEGKEEVPELMLEKYLTLRDGEERKELLEKLSRCNHQGVTLRLALLDFQEKGSLDALKDYVEKFGEAKDVLGKEEKSNMTTLISKMLLLESP